MNYEERAILGSRAGYHIFGHSYSGALHAVAAYFFASLGYAVIERFVPEFATASAVLIVAVIAIMFVFKALRLVPMHMYFRHLARIDQQAGTVEVIKIKNPRATEIEFENWPGALAIDIGQNKILVIQNWFSIQGAQKMIDGEMVQSIETILDTLEAEELGLKPSSLFPATNITITRFPNVGATTDVSTAGEYLMPDTRKSSLQVGENQRYLGDAVLLNGSLKDIEQILKRESEMRKQAYWKIVGRWGYPGLELSTS